MVAIKFFIHYKCFRSSKSINPRICYLLITYYLQRQMSAQRELRIIYLFITQLSLPEA